MKRGLMFLLIVGAVAGLVFLKFSTRIESCLPEYERVFYAVGGAETDENGAAHESVRFDAQHLSNVLSELGAHVVKTESAGGATIIYAYSPLVSGFVELSFGRVNIMVAVCGGNATLASPIIYGGY